MFGRRRHAAAEVPAAPTPQLTDARILELVQEKVDELIGENGEWTVSRRSEDDTDTIFHTVLAQSVSMSIAATIVEARRRVEAGEHGAVSAAQHRAAPEADAEKIDETIVELEAEHDEQPAAFSWEPAPITVWTDLRKPVTGEIPVLARPAA